MDRWHPKIEALRRLIVPDSGATNAERETAKRKLSDILQRYYGEDDGKRRYATFAATIKRDPTSTDEALAAAFSGEDWAEMGYLGVSKEGSWTADTPREAVRMMVADYARRLRARKGQRRLIR